MAINIHILETTLMFAGEAQQAITTPRYPQPQGGQFIKPQDIQSQGYGRGQPEAANRKRTYGQQQRLNANSQTVQNRQEEYRERNGQVHQQIPNERRQDSTYQEYKKTYAQAAATQPSSYSDSPQQYYYTYAYLHDN